ncbi:MAG: superinfection immunity protein [Mucilaginibacter sp.]|nr:superinfection immunity protein [Mucilaginibacter sp.]
MGLGGPELIIILIAIIPAICLYFLPAIIGRHKSNATNIFLVNLFLGWTFVGWVVALIWALSSTNPPIVYYNNTNTAKPIDKTGELFKFKELLDAGAITQEEFDKEKGRILNG